MRGRSWVFLELSQCDQYSLGTLLTLAHLLPRVHRGSIYFDLILQLRDPEICRNKMSWSETCDRAGARGSVSSGICDHVSVRILKVKSPSYEHPKAVLGGDFDTWEWGLGRYPELHCCPGLVREQLALSKQRMGERSSKWNSVERCIKYLLQIEL